MNRAALQCGVIAMALTAWPELSNAVQLLPATPPPTSPTSAFEFTYAAMITGLAAHTPGRVWVPIPPSDETQSAEEISRDVPYPAEVGREQIYGNRVLSFALPADHPEAISFSIRYRIVRPEAMAINRCPVATYDVAKRLLQPDEKVPVDAPFDRAIFARTAVSAGGNDVARSLYDYVVDHTEYRKDKPGWGNGNAAWACQSGFGNCTDFHSLYISLVRTAGLSALFQIGFSIGDVPAGDVAGYHCWCWVQTRAGQWTPMDLALARQHPAEKDFYFGHLDSHRVLFTSGRDLTLAPPQAGKPLNFFVYPYVELAAHPLDASHVHTKFSWRPVSIAGK